MELTGAATVKPDEAWSQRLSSYREVEPGDMVRRVLAGVVADDILVTAVDERFVYCNPFGWPEGWKFDRDTGFEVDEDLALPPGVVASFLTTVTKPTRA